MKKKEKETLSSFMKFTVSNLKRLLMTNIYDLLRVFSAIFIFCWPLLFWASYFNRTGIVPSNSIQRGFIIDGISHWFDIFFWWAMLGISFFYDELILRSGLLLESSSRLLLMFSLMLAGFLMLKLGVYSLIVFVSLFSIYLFILGIVSIAYYIFKERFF